MGLTTALAACAAGSYGAGPKVTNASRAKNVALHATQSKAQSLRTSKRSKMEQMLVYVGTYTTKGAKGIYLCELNMKTGDLTLKGSVATTPNPTFLALAPNHKVLYAANEIDNFQGAKAGAVSAWAIKPKTGALTLINESSTKGDGPCHVSVDNKGQYVFAANYGAGSLTAMPIQKNGGVGAATGFAQHSGTSVDPKRQEGPHAHSIYPEANGFIYAADLGLDKVFVYKLDSAGSFVANDPPTASVPPGSGPRHIALHPTAKFASVITEMLPTVAAMKWDSNAATKAEIQRGLRAQPKCASAYYFVGMLHKEEGSDDAAIAAFRRAVDLDERQFEAEQEIRVLETRRSRNSQRGGFFDRFRKK